MCAGSKVDSIDFWAQRVREAEAAIAREQHHILGGTPPDIVHSECHVCIPCLSLCESVLHACLCRMYVFGVFDDTCMLLVGLPGAEG